MLFSMPQLDMLRANLLGNADRFAEQSLLGSFILCNNPASIQKRERCDEAAKEAALLPDQWQNSMNFMIFLGHPIVSWPSEAFLDHLFPVPAMVVSGPCASIHKLLPTVSIAGTRTEKRFHLRLIPNVMEFQPTETRKTKSLGLSSFASLIRIPRVMPCRSEEHTSELQSPCNLVCRLLLEKKNAAQPGIGHDVGIRHPISD